MKTRGKVEKKRKRDLVYYENHCKSEEQREKKRKKDKERRERKKVEERMVDERFLVNLQKLEELKKAAKKEVEKPSLGCADPPKPQEPHEEMVDQSAEESEEDKVVVKDHWDSFRAVVFTFLLNPKSVKDLTSLSESELESLEDECLVNIYMTTYDGEPRKSIFSASAIPARCFLFFTLFWLRHYPPLSTLSAIFKIHKRTCSKILRRTIAALAKTFTNEVVFPSDSEMSAMMFTYGQNFGLGTIVCAVDGTEIRISRPSNAGMQSKTWSVKKHQNSLNLIIITKLTGEIIYFSPVQAGAHDQKQWNLLNLRSLFLGKTHGIIGDGGFTFNPKTEPEQINGQKPVKKPRKSTLTARQKNWNRKLSEMRVIVENTIRVLKVFKIVGSVFRHWRNGHGQISIDMVVRICVALANRRIRKIGLRPLNWKASDWRDVCT